MSVAHQEARVGAFVLLSVVVAIAFVLVLGRVSLGGGRPVCADFAYIGTLQPGAPVKISGVSVGRVRGVELLTPSSAPPAAKPVAQLGRADSPLVRVCATLDASAEPLVNDGLVFAVATQGIIGEAYLELEPHAGAALAAGAVVRGSDAPRLHVMTLQAEALMNFAGDLFNPSDTHALGDVGSAVSSLLGTVNGILTERRPAIVAALDNVSAASIDLRQVAAGLRTGVGDGAALRALVEQATGAVTLVQRELPPMAKAGGEALASLQALTDKANHALDPNTVETMVLDARATAEHLAQFSADAESVMRNVRRGEGTVGGLARDPQIYDDIKELLRDIKQHPWKVLWRD